MVRAATDGARRDVARLEVEGDECDERGIRAVLNATRRVFCCVFFELKIRWCCAASLGLGLAWPLHWLGFAGFSSWPDGACPVMAGAPRTVRGP